MKLRGFCIKCNEILTEENCSPSVFRVARGECTKCNTARTSKWKKNNPSKVKMYEFNRQNKHRKRYLNKKKLERRKRLEENPGYERLSYLKCRYGVTLDIYESLLKSQNNLCAICNKVFDRAPCVDHCHATNKNRGLLCGACNKGLGFFYDSPEIMLSAIAYIKKYR